MTPALTLILCSRNDGYMGNALWRLETTLNYLGEGVDALARAADVEVIVADWGSETPLCHAVALTPAAARITSFVAVPPARARELQRDSEFPEVLALNAAVRRAAGRFIGRIDQDTLVGERFLRWFFETSATNGSAAQTLFFSNRRNIPYRFAALSPRAAHVTRFVRQYGAGLPVNRKNAATGDVFWTSDVGIWLAHHNLWHECGGYDERLLYYNWMETDMICRLRQKYAVVDLGELTDVDFYHLEHFHPRSAWSARSHARKNAPVDLDSPPAVFHPNEADWGLRDEALGQSKATAARAATPSRRSTGRVGFAWVMTRVAAATALDRAAIFLATTRQMLTRRFARVGREIAGKPAARWPGVVWTLWAGRTRAGVRSGMIRTALARALSAAGLLAWARRARLKIALVSNPAIRRREREERERFRELRRDYGPVVGLALTPRGSGRKTALVVSSRCPTIEGELCVIKALQLAGYTPRVLLEDERRTLRPFYELAGVETVHLWSEFLTSHDFSGEAAAIVSRCRSLDELLDARCDGIRVGMIALCTTLRRLRCGALDLDAPPVRRLLVRSVAASLAAVAEARSILRLVRPELVLSDPEYTPKGELFETCLEHGLDVIAYDTAQSRSALIFKRYGRQNRDHHLTTLSSGSWARVRDLEWTRAEQRQLADEVATRYRDGDWFGIPPSPGPASRERADLLRSLGLDPAKKTAFVFPHMLWDAPVMWGKPLFSTYQEWFVETVRAACRNVSVNWVVRIHPAHISKQADEGYRGDAAELRVLRQQVGSLPPHVVVVPPEAPVSTLTLFAIMDYCLTVRGTVGVEAARLGIPVLTAGPARYSGLGFTIDSASRAEYLSRVARIQDVPLLSAAQRELAERFAYGLFLLRPLRLASVTWDGEQHARFNIRTQDDWRSAPDVGALAAWFLSHDEDFMAQAG